MTRILALLILLPLCGCSMGFSLANAVGGLALREAGAAVGRPTIAERLGFEKPADVPYDPAAKP
jgi:hypothetical protein